MNDDECERKAEGAHDEWVQEEKKEKLAAKLKDLRQDLANCSRRLDKIIAEVIND